MGLFSFETKQKHDGTNITQNPSRFGIFRPDYHFTPLLIKILISKSFLYIGRGISFPKIIINEGFKHFL